MDGNAFDEILRLFVATGAGIVIGINREMHDKPLGIPGESAVPTSVTPCWFEPAAPHQTPRYDRDRLPTGVRIAGPAIVEDAWSTIVVPPGYTLGSDAMGHLWIREDAR